MTQPQKTVAIIGAGPVGLAAAAHVARARHESGGARGGACGRSRGRQWGHVRLFSPWEYNIDRAAERLLAAAGWNSPDPLAYPTGARIAGAIPRAAGQPHARCEHHIQTSSRVTAISRIGFDKVKTKGREQAPFEHPLPERRRIEDLRADAVIDASGTWSSPNPAGRKRPRCARRSRSIKQRIAYAMPDVLGRDRARYAGKIVAVLGSGHSAIGTLDRSGSPQARSAGHPSHLAAARRQPEQGLRRRRQ